MLALLYRLCISSCGDSCSILQQVRICAGMTLSSYGSCSIVPRIAVSYKRSAGEKGLLLHYYYSCSLFPLQIAVSGKSFNHSARDAWELFQSTGVEALVAYDCSGAVLLMGTVLGGLITGTCAGVWTWLRSSDRVLMVGSTSMLMGMVLVSIGQEFDDHVFFCMA